MNIQQLVVDLTVMWMTQSQSSSPVNIYVNRSSKTEGAGLNALLTWSFSTPVTYRSEGEKGFKEN